MLLRFKKKSSCSPWLRRPCFLGVRNFDVSWGHMRQDIAYERAEESASQTGDHMSHMITSTFKCFNGSTRKLRRPHTCIRRPRSWDKKIEPEADTEDSWRFFVCFKWFALLLILTPPHKSHI
jgi:hypothetical protein